LFPLFIGVIITSSIGLREIGLRRIAALKGQTPAPAPDSMITTFVILVELLENEYENNNIL